MDIKQARALILSIAKRFNVVCEVELVGEGCDEVLNVYLGTDSYILSDKNVEIVVQYPGNLYYPPEEDVKEICTCSGRAEAVSIMFEAFFINEVSVLIEEQNEVLHGS